MEDEITILLADDHPIVRQGPRQAIELDPRLRVIAEAGDGREALRLMRTLQPQIAVLDIDMPHLDGVEVARAAREEQLMAAVIFLTVYHEERFFNHALDLGITFNVYGDTAGAERIFPFDLIPRIIPAAEEPSRLQN